MNCPFGHFTQIRRCVLPPRITTRLYSTPRHIHPAPPPRAESSQAHNNGGSGGPGPPKRPTQEHEDDHHPGLSSIALGALISLLLLTIPAPAHAKDTHIDDFVDKVMVTAGPMLTTLGFSGIIGVCVGKALKAVSGCLAIAVGLTFIGVQGAAYLTGKEIDYTSLGKDSWLREDVSDAMKSGLQVVTVGLPSVGGFLAGLAIGFKW